MGPVCAPFARHPVAQAPGWSSQAPIGPLDFRETGQWKRPRTVASARSQSPRARRQADYSRIVGPSFVEPTTPPSPHRRPLRPPVHFPSTTQSSCSSCATPSPPPPPHCLLPLQQRDGLLGGAMPSVSFAEASAVVHDAQQSQAGGRAHARGGLDGSGAPVIDEEPGAPGIRVPAQLARGFSLVPERLGKSSGSYLRTGNKGMFGCETAIKLLAYLAALVCFPFTLCVGLKVIAQYERAVMFRLGRLVSEIPKGPGLVFLLPCLDSMKTVDLRTFTFNVPTQEVLTKDSVTVAVDAVVYYRIFDPVMSVVNVEDANRSTRLLAQTTLRNVLGTVDLYQLLTAREQIAHLMQDCLDTATETWGVKVERVDIKDVRLPIQLQRAMAAEAEAAREAKAKVIAAEGEQRASVALKAAAVEIGECPIALQLRYLQTLSSISDEKNSTIIFPLPIDLLTLFSRNLALNADSACGGAFSDHNSLDTRDQPPPPPSRAPHHQHHQASSSSAQLQGDSAGEDLI